MDEKEKKELSEKSNLEEEKTTKEKKPLEKTRKSPITAKKKETYLYMGTYKGKLVLKTKEGNGVLIDIPKYFKDAVPGETIEL
jgi:hypothetical protein